MIIKQFPQMLTKTMSYQMTNGKNNERMKDYAGEDIKAVAYIVFEDVKQDGSTLPVVCIYTDDKHYISSNSQSFVRDFIKLCDVWENEELPSFRPTICKSSKGREYLTLTVIPD